MLYAQHLGECSTSTRKESVFYLVVCVCSTINVNLVKLNDCCYLVYKLCPTLWDPMDYSPLGYLSMGFSRQEYWSGLPSPSPGDLPDPGMEPLSPILAGGFFTIQPLRKPKLNDSVVQTFCVHFLYHLLVLSVIERIIY